MLSRSIRLRLEFWFAFMQLAITLAAGIYLYCLDGSNRLQQLDASLERRLTPLHFAARDSLDIQDKPPSHWQVPPNVTLESFHSRTGFLHNALLGNGSELFSKQWVQEGVYFSIWSQTKDVLVASPNLPASLTPPKSGDTAGPITFRNNGNNREAFQFTAANDIVLVGQSKTQMQAEHSAYLKQILAFIVILFAIGLLATWRIIHRAISPLEAIAKDAAQMSVGHLHGRLQGRLTAPNPDDEVGQLVEVLNSTFARLDAAFSQQKRFVADAAHELRTPLAVMLSEAQAVLNRPRTAEQYKTSLEQILEAIQKLRKLSESLLTLARLDSADNVSQPEPFDLALLIDECIALISPLAIDKRISLHNRVSALSLQGNPDQICSLFTNLLSNAVEYGVQNGEVHVWTTRDSAHSHCVGVHVSNTGDTISSQDREHLFERFYRVDKSRSRAGNHAGLGLAICHRIVQEHQGSISVSSDNGLTVFSVWLPVIDASGHSP